MNWEEANLISKDDVVNNILHKLACHNVSVAKMQEIKKVLEGQEYTAQYLVGPTTEEAEHIRRLEALDFMVYKKHGGRAVVKSVEFESVHELFPLSKLLSLEALDRVRRHGFVCFELEGGTRGWVFRRSCLQNSVEGIVINSETGPKV